LKHRAGRALGELGAAGPLGAVCLLAANDHQFKRLFHNALTGKLSDVAVCFLLPLLVSAALGLVFDWTGRRRLAIGAVVATVVYTMLELSDTAGALFLRTLDALGLGGGTLTRDPTDLLALVCVPLAVAYGRRRLTVAEHHPNIWRSATGALVMATGSLALMATEISGPKHDCDVEPPPVTFQAGSGCGPGGLVVVSSHSYNATGAIEISNGAALGLPLDYGSDVYVASFYDQKGALTHACAFDQGSWGITFYEACNYDICVCNAIFANGMGSFECRRGSYSTKAYCTSSLTVVPGGETDGGSDGD
jgi:hypothetical protein